MAAKKFTEQEALKIIRPYADRLWRVAALPIFTYFETYPNLTIHTPRTRANIIHDLNVHQARSEFVDVPEAVMIDLQIGHTLFELAGKILLRCKKLDEAKNSSNVQTTFIRDYDLGTTLPGLPDRAQRLTLGYRLNSLQNGLRDIFITSKRLQIELQLHMPNPKVVSIAMAQQVYQEARGAVVQVITRAQEGLLEQ